jgi:hypothetical protein
MNTKPESKRTFDEEVARVLVQMETMSVDSEAYANAVKNLEVLCQARSQKTNSWLSADLVVPAVVNLLGILLVLNYEQMHIVTSKAFGFIARGKV